MLGRWIIFLNPHVFYCNNFCVFHFGLVFFSSGWMYAWNEQRARRQRLYVMQIVLQFQKIYEYRAQNLKFLSFKYTTISLTYSQIFKRMLPRTCCNKQIKVCEITSCFNREQIHASIKYTYRMVKTGRVKRCQGHQYFGKMKRL